MSRNELLPLSRTFSSYAPGYCIYAGMFRVYKPLQKTIFTDLIFVEAASLTACMHACDIIPEYKCLQYMLNP